MTDHRRVEFHALFPELRIVDQRRFYEARRDEYGILLDLCIKSTKAVGGSLRDYFHTMVLGCGAQSVAGGEGVESAFGGGVDRPRHHPALRAGERTAGDPRGTVGGRDGRVWVDGAPTPFANIFEERKFAEGSFATFLGCELSGIESQSPVWTTVALGDTVLFHVGDGRLVEHFPALSCDEFGLNPDGVHTAPAALPDMMRQLRFAENTILVADRLFLATDALAEWIVRTHAREGDGRVCSLLSQFSHPDAFERFVVDRRMVGEMKNDDVTLMRVHVVETDPDYLLVCR
ncbi:MAG: hypothetical protein M3Z25_04480 [Actinomycetota bacterium]|nr:hypothetical protein [Actinomycetota bacterium]